ncbi:MAG: hypothetical protein GQ535_16025 [Rhodobacteraceae bacterium]|nr:hypothetical protein [Paracoccaceae bacterium]
MRLPNLFVAGFWKCATTSLAKYLSDHPDIDTTRYKETYYFLDENSPLRNDWGSVSDPEDTTLKELFGTAGSAEYFLDSTPCYYSQKTALEHIQKIGGKAIFIIRDPSLRFCSSFEFFTHVYQEYPKTTLLNYTKRHLAGELSEFYSAMSSEFHTDILRQDLTTGHYWDHIRSWKDALGDNVLITSTEKLQSFPSETMAEVCSFLDIDNVYEDYHFEKYQKGYVVRSDALHRTLRRVFKFDPMEYGNFTQEHSHFHPLQRGPLRNFLEGAYARLQHRPVSYAEQPLELLRAYYEPYNRILAENTGIDYTIKNTNPSKKCAGCSNGCKKMEGMGFQ